MIISSRGAEEKGSTAFAGKKQDEDDLEKTIIMYREPGATEPLKPDASEKGVKKRSEQDAMAETVILSIPHKTEERQK